MNLLVLDTAGPVIGLAAFEGPNLRYLASSRVAAGAEAWLAVELESALRTVPSLDRVGVSVGPGTFTGLRVGVASALGLAFAAGIGVVPVSSLALRAAAAPGHLRVLSLLDAKKGRVYAGWFDTTGTTPRALDAERDTFLPEATAGLPGLATGEGASVFADAIRAAGHLLHEAPDRSPVASAYTLVATSEALSPERVGLRYLREPDAVPSRV